MKIKPNANLLIVSRLRMAGILTLLLTRWTIAADLQPSTVPTTALTQPAPTGPRSTQPDGKRYESDDKNGGIYGNMERRIAKLKGPCDLIFIGDSITQGWNGNVWTEFYGKRTPLNYGIPGDATQNVLFRLNYEGLKTLKPKVAVILIGTNNTGDPAAEIAAGVKAVINKTLELFPDCKIILLDILPTARKTETVVAANALIAQLSDEKKIFRLNLGEKMIKEGDSWKGLGKDRLHLTEEGYRIWAETMEPLLARLLDEKKP